MEVAIGSNGSPPFQREVREWQRVDPNTGALLTGRLEADRWITSSQNAYGKVVDSQNVSQPNGIQHTQRKQLEVLQARTSSGSLQVVRAQTQTVQTSSSRWSSSSNGTKTTQSLGGQRFSIPLQMITNGNHHAMTNGSHDPHQLSHNSHHQLITEPSLKLSSLMRNSVASSSSSSRSSPRSPTMFGSTVSQRHHHEATYPALRPTDRGGGSSFEAFNHKHHDMSSERSTAKNSDTDRLQHLHRGRSVSNDDLASSDHWENADVRENGEDTADWRRVSKIRRSFQFPKSSSPPKTSPSRPVDLPENSVSVSRIRDELEHGRRPSNIGPSDREDLVALDVILNGGSPPSLETESKSKKKTSLLAVDSLKDIRGKLKKLSDESLYKDDFLALNNIERRKQLEGCSQQDFTIEKPAVIMDSQIVHQPSVQVRSKVEASLTSSNLENRVRHRDTTSSEWYLRRKSYGFERMAPPSNTMSRHETSRDSGLGRSGELASWSPTDGTPRGTVITFSDTSATTSKASITVMNGGPAPRYNDVYDDDDDVMEAKRHSIAVDESKYVRDNLRNAFESKSSINLNGFYTKEVDTTQSTVFDDNGRRQKRVEFCKTEVHFAAESGRVNIVETDGKPPPTNNFRRRRRGSSGPISSAYLEAITSGKPVIHFGDDRKVHIEQSSQHTTIEESNNVTVITNGAPDVVAPCSVQEEETEPLFDEISIRGILKNKPIKPKPFLLGENIENSESLWGVRLRPVSTEIVSTKSEDISEGKKETASTNNSSVAERVRIVEERHGGTGYSTKINLNLSNSPYSWESSPDARSQVADPNKKSNSRMDDRRKSTHFEILGDSLKSTSLIMKTIRSRSCYDDPSFRLQMPDFTVYKRQVKNTENTFDKSMTASNSGMNISSRLITNSSSVSDTSRTNILLDGTDVRIPDHVSECQRKDLVVSEDDSSSQSSKLVSSCSFSSTSSSSYQLGQASSTEQFRIRPPTIEVPNKSFAETMDQKKKPIAAPRVKIIGSSNTVSHQLSQLRRMYDAAEADGDDECSRKADEEVKLYLGHGNIAAPIEEKTTELSGSWSRVKAKRANVKSQTKTDLKELPKSNVMTIELHSPTVTLERNPKESQEKLNQEIPTPKPRHSVRTKISTKRLQESNLVERADLVEQSKQEQRPQKDEASLKIAGARKLKDHELLYFGVQVKRPSERTRTKSPSKSNNQFRETNQKITVTARSVPSESNSDKWKLSSDKPDLLRHSPVATFRSEKRIEKDLSRVKNDETAEHRHHGPVYENLQKPSAYHRKRDAERDQMILKEMNEEAEQSLQDISSDKASRNQHRRSSQRSSKPLETIDEKRSSKRQQQEVKIVAQSTSEPLHYRSCCSNRSSSISSTESLTRQTDSLRNKNNRKDYINDQGIIKKHRSSSSKDSPHKPHQHRSSSRETQRTTASSSEDLHNGMQNGHHGEEPLRRSRRTKASSSREKDRIVLKVDENQRISRSTVKMVDDRGKGSGHKGSSDSTVKAVGGSMRSSKSEKHDKSGTTKSKVSSTRSSTDSRKMSRSKTTSGVVPPATYSSTKRSGREHTRK